MATLKEKIGYGFGDMSSSMFWKIFSYYLPFFYSNIFGLSLADAGLLMLVYCVSTIMRICRSRSLRRASVICSVPNEANSSKQNRTIFLCSGGLDEKYSIDWAVIMRSRSP